MRTPCSAPHTAFLYASRAGYCAAVVDFVGGGTRSGERVVVITTSAGWDDIGPGLNGARFERSLAAQHDNLVILDAAMLLERIVCADVFERARFNAELQLLLRDGRLPQRMYSDAASLLVARRNLPAALALEHAEHEMSQDGPVRVWCGFDVRRFPEAEHDWQVRSVINSHDEAVIEPGACTTRIPESRGRTEGLSELILLWDDHADTQVMYAEALTFAGYRVITAADASHAFTLGSAYRPDLLVLDVRLPAKRAVTTMRSLRAAQDFKAPILALTAHAFAEELESIFNDGFDAVLSKPCLPEVLVAAVARALDRE